MGHSLPSARKVWLWEVRSGSRGQDLTRGRLLLCCWHFPQPAKDNSHQQCPPLLHGLTQCFTLLQLLSWLNGPTHSPIALPVADQLLLLRGAGHQGILVAAYMLCTSLLWNDLAEETKAGHKFRAC